MMTRILPIALLGCVVGATCAQAQNVGGAGGQGGNATVNIYGGTIYLTPQGGDGGAGGSARGGGGPVPGGPSAVPRGGPSLWNHNGSTMRLEADGARRRFFYAKPRPGIVAAGAAPGTMLFEGVRRGDGYSGVAKVFAWECGAYPYKVSGRAVSERSIVMSGMAPSVSRATCTVTGYREDRLEFDYLGD